LLSLAEDEVLLPVLHTVDVIFNIRASDPEPGGDEELWLRNFQRFLQVLYLFLKDSMPSLAITFDDPEALSWFDFAWSRLGSSPNDDVALRRNTLAVIKSLVSFHQGSPVGLVFLELHEL